jgi:hypothetical protein
MTNDEDTGFPSTREKLIGLAFASPHLAVLVLLLDFITE